MTKRQRDLLRAINQNKFLAMGPLDIIDEDINWLISAGYVMAIENTNFGIACAATQTGRDKHQELTNDPRRRLSNQG